MPNLTSFISDITLPFLILKKKKEERLERKKQTKKETKKHSKK